MNAGREAESVLGQLPATAMRNTGPVAVWSVDALDRFVCWMTYARLFERFDLLGAWIDSAEQFSLVLWDRWGAAGALGCTVSVSEWSDPAGQSPEPILVDLVARARAVSTGPADPGGINWDRESEIRHLPWEVLPLAGVGPAEGLSGPGGGWGVAPVEDGEAAFKEAVRELRYVYRGASWASTMAWRMIDGFRTGWFAHLCLLAGWVSAPSEVTIILHDATTVEQEEPHRDEIARLLLPGQHTPRVGSRVWRLDDFPPPWRNDHIESVSDDLAELTASTPTSGLARHVASDFARLDGGTIWIRTRPTDPTPRNPWADVHRQVLDG